ncbi:glycosyltransferase [Bacteroides oleiciplenus]|uniref:glycosyltransferase n=1 Tax=Bacteroides oleiciplenus TaxID=626931 RepID=UPI0026DC68B3|nr:glycosyltransferase [Bacteroides oleiciplenus]
MFQESIERKYKVSVALAVYNGERYLAEQLDSILWQLKDGDELVVSVDSSKDRTMDILEKYSSFDSKIKVYKNPYSSGVVHNFQNALEHTTGDIIFYSDQDDVWMKNKIDKVLESFDDEMVTVVIHDTCLTDEKLNIISPSTFKLRGGARTSVIGNYIRLSYIGCAMAFRAKFKSVILPIPTIYRSHDWWTGLICIVGGGKMVAIKESLIYHRIHSLNVTPKIRPSLQYQIQIRWILFSNIFKRYKKRISIK